MHFPDWRPEQWTDRPDNPVIGLWDNDYAHSAIGDPQILLPGDFDNQWHAFYHGFYHNLCDGSFTPVFHHSVSEDGFHWSYPKMVPFGTGPVSLFFDKGTWYLYYSAMADRFPELQKDYGDFIYVVCVKESRDLENWSEGRVLLTPELPWEREAEPTDPLVEIRNPCMVKLPNGRYRLYYSAGTVKLFDCGYEEPKYIGFAESDSPLGPFVKHPTPILSPCADVPHRNYGAGAIKVYATQKGFIGFYNGIYRDAEGNSRSAINVIASEDGVTWEEAPYNPIILPALDGGWKDTLIYQLDLVRWGDELRLYYNARNGTATGTEKIGCSVIKDAETTVRKLWGK